MSFKTKVQKYDDYFKSVYSTRYVGMTLRDATLEIENTIDKAVEKLKKNDASALPLVCAFLELPEKHFRSGYSKEKIFHALKRVSLNDEEKKYLQNIFINELRGSGREFGECVKLFPLLRDDEFDQQILALKERGEPYIVKRVERIQKDFWTGGKFSPQTTSPSTP
jgi:hypothetical protein